jgi:hypothetical protein
VQEIGGGTISFYLVPSGVHQFEGRGLLQGADPPPCDAYSFAFSWMIVNPSPPTGQEVAWEVIEGDERQSVASGAEGATSVGCGQLLATNLGTQTILVSVYYVHGQITG